MKRPIWQTDPDRVRQQNENKQFNSQNYVLVHLKGKHTSNGVLQAANSTSNTRYSSAAAVVQEAEVEATAETLVLARKFTLLLYMKNIENCQSSF